MVKYLLIVINSLFLFVYGLFNSDGGITVNGKIPAQMVAGEATAIEITVNKGSMNGFAKLQLDLPEGFTVKESEEKGATYTFNEGIAKWVWAALPSESEIVIHLSIVAPAGSAGVKTIGAKYSYVENNIKQMVEMVPAEITVVAETGAVTTTYPTPEATVAATTPSDSTAAPPVTSNIESPGKVVGARSIEPSGIATSHTIQITITKDGTKGFARYSDELPENTQVESIKTDGASFSVSDGKIKFVWVNVPDKETLEVSYVMTSNASRIVSLKGEYSYLEDNQSKTLEMPAAELTFEVKAETEKAAELPAVATLPETSPTENKLPETTTAKTEKKVGRKQSGSKTTRQEREKQSQLLAAETPQSLFYAVQIGAFNKRKVTVARLEKRFKVTESIRSEMQGGFSKFMVGEHPEYKGARDHRETVVTSNGIKSAFVVAYNQGKRITVQEALMVSNQKWFK